MNHPETQSLLEILRYKQRFPESKYPTTNDETSTTAKQQMLLLLHHRLEFPSLMAEFLIRAKCRCETPKEFLSEAYHCAKRLLVGSTAWDDDEDKEWRGLDSATDTEECVECMIRFFPQVLGETVLLSLGESATTNNNKKKYLALPIQILLTRAKTLAFVPLLLEMHKEWGLDSVGTFSVCKYLLVPGEETWHQVFQSNSTITTHNNNQEEEELVEVNELKALEEPCLSALVRIKEMRLLQSNKDIDALVKWLLSKLKVRYIFYVEHRLRLLIDWNPFLLKEFQRSKPCPLLRVFWKYTGYPPGKGLDRERRLFETIVELGLTHFPQDLGFAFDGDEYHKFCQRYGTEWMLGLLQSKLVQASKPNVTLQSLVIAAASNHTICVEVVYTLLRMDPTAFIPGKPF